MDSLEKPVWYPVYVVLICLLITAGAYFFKQSLLTHYGDDYLNKAITKGKFTESQINGLMNKLENLGFDRSEMQLEISPGSVITTGVSKDSGEDIQLTINTNQKPFIAYIFEFLTGECNIKYYYTRAASSEEYLD